MVPNANAIIYPWAMMIKSLYAYITDSAMSRTRSPDYFAVRAEISGIEL